MLKNTLGSRITWESVREMKTVGLLREDEKTGIWEIGVPDGSCCRADSFHQSHLHGHV